MKTIYLVDYIGNHSGMDYYLEAFKNVLESAGSYRVEILSNYPTRTFKKGFFNNQYQGSSLKKGLCLLKNLHRLRKFTQGHKEDVFAYLTYGNGIDLPFLRIISSMPNHIIDLHEVIAQSEDKNARLYRALRNIYQSKIKAVISHSGRTDDFLSDFGYNKEILHVPHFRYVFPKDYVRENIALDLYSAVAPNKINLLFFGNLNHSKGVDVLLYSFNQLPDDICDRFNLIIAGKDYDGSVYLHSPRNPERVHVFARHITDDELRFLYQNVDYLCLPYRKTSQSGILEMAFYFKKPIVATNLPYFEKTLEEFPSFGVLAGSSPEDYAKALKSLLNIEKTLFFKSDEYARYENRAEIESFKADFNRWINTKA